MMNAFAVWSPRRRLLTCGLAVAIVAALVVAALALASPRAAHKSPPLTAPTASASVTIASPAEPTEPSTPAVLPRLARTDDPVAYARAAAEALFGVDPASVSRTEFLRFWRGELPSVVYADAAAKGLTLAAQDADVIDNLTVGWIPPPPAWDTEAAEHTTNLFTITSVTVPDYWVNAVADGTFRDPGLHMQRVMGVLTQTYGSHRHTSSRPVVIDLGLLCGPTQPAGCRLVAPQQPPRLGDA
jgi:hypothetical protein